nr:hypothetical protein [Bacteroidales bacterium]
GYDGPLDYAVWLLMTNLGTLPQEGLRQIWEAESALCRKASSMSLKEIAERRINEITQISRNYE